MKKTLLFILSVLFLISCNDDTKSDNAEIVDLSVTAFSNTDLIFEKTSIDSQTGCVYIFLNNDLTQHTFPISLTSNIELSSGAKTTSFLDGELSFSSPDEVKTMLVVAEDGSIKNWFIYLIHQQIQNSGFESWFTNVGMNGYNYNEIGNSAVESFWATANMGTSMYSIYGTQALYEGENTLVQIKTDSTNVPVTAGTLFTGRFDIAGAISNPTDPKKATLFGIPFIYKPTGMKIKFKYQAGPQYIQATLKNPTNIFMGFTIEEVAGEDECSIYAILENRIGDQVTEVGRAKLDSGTTADILTETLIPFTYSSTENPTHITIVFTSSKDGDLWKGAKGSTLIIDDLEFVY